MRITTQHDGYSLSLWLSCRHDSLCLCSFISYHWWVPYTNKRRQPAPHVFFPHSTSRSYTNYLHYYIWRQLGFDSAHAEYFNYWNSISYDGIHHQRGGAVEIVNSRKRRRGIVFGEFSDLWNFLQIALNSLVWDWIIYIFDAMFYGTSNLIRMSTDGQILVTETDQQIRCGLFFIRHHHLEFVSCFSNIAIYSYLYFQRGKELLSSNFKPNIDSYSMLSRIELRIYLESVLLVSPM